MMFSFTVIEKDLMLLKEVDELASASDGKCFACCTTRPSIPLHELFRLQKHSLSNSMLRINEKP